MTGQASLPHRRYNPLLDEWVLVSPHRTARPWQGAQGVGAGASSSAYEASCYLCPGNERSSGQRNPAYETTYTFPNDFPALLGQGAAPESDGDLFQAEASTGECRVICYSPRHDLTLAGLPEAELLRVVQTWGDIASELGERWKWVQIFENKGEMMGCSSPHPHGQVWAGDSLPTIPAREDSLQAAYLAARGKRLLQNYAQAEAQKAERTFTLNEEWVWVVPFWAVWPFETLLIPRRPTESLGGLDAAQTEGLAAILKIGLSAYDNLFNVSFPYSMGWHGAPSFQDSSHWQLHAHFYPPLLRSATVRKFMVGYELLAEAQRDLTPEAAASRLREVCP